MTDEISADDESSIALFGRVIPPEELNPPKKNIPVEPKVEEPIREATDEDIAEFNIKLKQLLKDGEPHIIDINSYDWFLPMWVSIRDRYSVELEGIFSEAQAYQLDELFKATRDKVKASKKAVESTSTSNIATSKGLVTLANKGDWISPTNTTMTRCNAYQALDPIWMKVLDYMLEQLHSDMINGKDVDKGITCTFGWLKTNFNYKISDRSFTKAMQAITTLGFFRKNPKDAHAGPTAKRYIYINKWRHLSATDSKEKVDIIKAKYRRDFKGN